MAQKGGVEMFGLYGLTGLSSKWSCKENHSKKLELAAGAILAFSIMIAGCEVQPAIARPLASETPPGQSVNTSGKSKPIVSDEVFDDAMVATPKNSEVNALVELEAQRRTAVARDGFQAPQKTQVPPEVPVSQGGGGGGNGGVGKVVIPEVATPVPVKAVEPTEAPNYWIDPNYLGKWGQAKITPVDCYSREYGQVAPPTRPIEYIKQPKDIVNNGVAAKHFTMKNLVVAGCEMNKVVLTEHPEIKPFTEGKLILLGLNENAHVVEFEVRFRAKFPSGRSGYFPEEGNFRFEPGQTVMLDVAFMTSVSDQSRKVLEGIPIEYQIALGSWPQKAGSYSDFKSNVNNGNRIIIGDGKYVIDNLS